MAESNTNRMAGNIRNTFPSRIPENISVANAKSPNQQPNEAAKSHVPTRNSTNTQIQQTNQPTVQPQQEAPQPIVTTPLNTNLNVPLANSQSAPSTTAPAKPPVEQPQQIQTGQRPNMPQGNPATTHQQSVQRPRPTSTENKASRTPGANKISESYQNMMSPKPLEGNSLRLLILLGIASLIIYIATLVL